VQEIYTLGIRAVNIYVKVSEEERQYRKRSLDKRLMQDAIRAIKGYCPDE
jgi:porphobilinogen synthase